MPILLDVQTLFNKIDSLTIVPLMIGRSTLFSFSVFLGTSSAIWSFFVPSLNSFSSVQSCDSLNEEIGRMNPDIDVAKAAETHGTGANVAEQILYDCWVSILYRFVSQWLIM